MNNPRCLLIDLHELNISASAWIPFSRRHQRRVTAAMAVTVASGCRNVCRELFTELFKAKETNELAVYYYYRTLHSMVMSSMCDVRCERVFGIRETIVYKHMVHKCVLSTLRMRFVCRLADWVVHFSYSILHTHASISIRARSWQRAHMHTHTHTSIRHTILQSVHVPKYFIAEVYCVPYTSAFGMQIIGFALSSKSEM